MVKILIHCYSFSSQGTGRKTGSPTRLPPLSWVERPWPAYSMEKSRPGPGTALEADSKSNIQSLLGSDGFLRNSNCLEYADIAHVVKV